MFWVLGLYISESRILLLLSPFVALVRSPDVEVLTILSSNFTNFFLGSRGYLGIVPMVLWREHCSWCLLTFRGCGSVPGSWAPRCSRHNFIVEILEYLSFADIENLFYAVVGEITSTPPSTGAGVREYCHSSYNGCFSKVEVHDFRSFLGYVLTDGYSWSVGLVSCVIYIVPSCIPNTRLHNQKVLGVYRWEFM